MYEDATLWRLQIVAVKTAAQVIASLPSEVQWGISVTDEDSVESPPTFNIYVRDDMGRSRVMGILRHHMPGAWSRFGDTWSQRVNGLLVSVVQDEEI